MLTVNRLELLQALKTVQPGISTKGDTVEQSSCFIFRNGHILTYNVEVSCRLKCSLLQNFTGAVQAKSLLEILGKLTEEEVGFEPQSNEIIIHGERRSTGIRMEEQVLLPIQHVERPNKESWVKLHEDFAEAISIVQESASEDEKAWLMTCVHIHPEWVEACDNHQMTRYTLPTGVSCPFLVRRDSLKHIIGAEVGHFNETPAWVHFKSPSGLILSCRRFLEDYKDLTPMTQFKGRPMQLPRGLDKAAENAEVFARENTDSKQIQVEMKSGKIRVRGDGISGWYREVKDIKYNGPEITFFITPKLLAEITKKHNECEVSAERLKVNGGPWVFVASLKLLKSVPKVEK